MLELSPVVELPNDEHVRHREPNTYAYLRSTLLGEGTLFISEDRFIWQTDNGQGITLAYPQISLHAISRDLSNFRSECLYLMFEKENSGRIDDTGDYGAEDLEQSGEQQNEINELRFVPRDLTQLEPMYRALCHCQLLHPDPQDSFGEEEDGSDDDEQQDDDDGHDNGLNIEAHGQFDDV